MFYRNLDCSGTFDRCTAPSDSFLNLHRQALLRHLRSCKLQPHISQRQSKKNTSYTRMYKIIPTTSNGADEDPLNTGLLPFPLLASLASFSRSLWLLLHHFTQDDEVGLRATGEGSFCGGSDLDRRNPRPSSSSPSSSETRGVSSGAGDRAGDGMPISLSRRALSRQSMRASMRGDPSLRVI
jgi:hypothetical protein